MWEALLPNLIATGIGIIVDLAITYLIINEVLKRAEKKRLKPLRNWVCSDLLDILDLFISHTLPKPFWNFSKVYYCFGDVKSDPIQVSEGVIKYGEELTSNPIFRNLMYDQGFDDNYLIESLNKIKDFRRLYATVLDPEMLALLFEIDQHIDAYEKGKIFYKEFNELGQRKPQKGNDKKEEDSVIDEDINVMVEVLVNYVTEDEQGNGMQLKKDVVFSQMAWELAGLLQSVIKLQNLLIAKSDHTEPIELFNQKKAVVEINNN